MSDEETLVFYGDAIKALGDGKVAGYLVRYSTDNDPDLTDEYFTAKTEYGVIESSTLPVYYQHGMDSQIGIKSIGRGTVQLQDAGLWFEAQLQLADEYEKQIYALAEAGKLGWSSGAAGHLVEKVEDGKAWRIKSWPIAEASLTPTPAEPRNKAQSVKSLLTTPVEVIQPIEEESNKMTDEELKAMLEGVASAAADAAVKKYSAEQSEVKTGYVLEVIEDEADKAAQLNPFKTAGAYFKAVKDAALDPQGTDKRLLAMKATGMNEAIPSQGGFLVQQDIASGIMQQTFATGAVLSQFTPTNVSGNGLVVNLLDQTSSRADGYRHGGVLGYWLAEAATKTPTKPLFRQLSLKLKKVAALVYATDELLEDETALGSWLTTNVPTELRFQVESAIISGNGVGKPLGIIASPAYYELARVDANEIDAVDVSNMWAHRYAGATDYVWFVSSTIFPQLQVMSVGQMPVYMPPGGMSDSPYGRLFGRPVIETEYNPSLGIAGDIVLASPSQYTLISKGGIQTASSIHVAFTTDESCFRFVYRVDGAPSWNGKMASYYASSDYFSPFVGLTASS